MSLSLIRRTSTMLILASLGCGSPPAVAPTAYTQFESKDKQVRLEYPTGWEVNATGGQSVMSHSGFTQGSAKISVDCDLVGSLFAGPAIPLNDPNQVAPVARIHELGVKKMQEEMSGYEEQPAQPIQTRTGEARISEFTAPGALGKKIRGYRATALTRDRRVTVVCTCPESDWETLNPAFTKLVASLSPGSGR